MNSAFAIRQARSLAELVALEAGDEAEERVRHYYRTVFQRDATPEEVRTGVGFIASTDGNMVPVVADDDDDAETVEPLTAWELYAQTLLLSNELLFLD